MSRKFKIFIASSGELMEHRDELELKIASKNKILMDEKAIFIELVRWEDISAAIAQESLQKIYDEEIKVCDMFVLLASDKIGQYTKEEFDVAHETFKRKNRPKILTFFDKRVESIDNTIDEFKKELEDIGHFYSFYDSFNDFWIQLNKQLDILLKKPKDNKTAKQIGGLPPFNPHIFLGRDSDIEDIYRSFFENGKAVLLINGNGGIGKTTVASKYYYQYQDKYTHQIWAINESEIDNTFLSLAIELNVSFDAQDTKEKSVLRVLKRLNELDKPTLFIIDNVDSLEDLEKNYQYLLQIPKLHILITSRVQDFDFFEKHNIDKLPPDIAKELFIKHYQKYQESESELLDRVLEMIDYNTLLIEILAKNLNQFNKLKPYTLQDMLQDMANGGILNIKAKEVNVYHYKLKKQTPQDIIKAMYSLSSLNEIETKVLSVFSIVPAITIPFEELESFLDIEDLDEILLRLHNTSWLNYDEENSTFSINPIVAEIVREKNKTSLYQNAQKLIDKIKDVLNYEGRVGVLKDYQKATIYVNYAESILKYLKDIKVADYNFSLVADRAGWFNFNYGSLAKALEYYKEYNRLTKELYERDRNNVGYKKGLAISCNRLGEIYITHGNLDKAKEYYEEDLKLTTELYDNNRKNAGNITSLAVSYNNLGNIYFALSNLDKAKEYYEEDLKLIKELYESNKDNVNYKHNLAISYSKLGGIYKTLGNIDEALMYYEEYLKLIKELYESNKDNVAFKYSLAISYSKLGGIYETRGNIDEALMYYEEDLKLIKELYESNKDNVNYKNSLAISYNSFGDIYTTRGDLTKALECKEKSFIIREELYTQNPNRWQYDYFRAVFDLAYLLYEENQKEKSKKLLEKLLAKIEPLYLKDATSWILEYSSTLNNLAELTFDFGNENKAIELATKVLDIREKAYKENPDDWEESYKNILENLKEYYEKIEDNLKLVEIGEKLKKLN